jgi:hypothetical protein
VTGLLNHDALYDLIEAVALFMIFRGAGPVRRGRASSPDRRGILRCPC